MTTDIVILVIMAVLFIVGGLLYFGAVLVAGLVWAEYRDDVGELGIIMGLTAIIAFMTFRLVVQNVFPLFIS